MNILVIANPISGGGRAGHLSRRLAECLRSRGHATQIRLTGQAGDARRLAADLDPEPDRLVVVGGDGTLNEVLNGLRDPTRIPLTQLATGTGNILAHELRLPGQPEQMARLVETGRIRLLDLGRVGQRRFLAVVSAGFDAMVARAVHETRTGTLGYLGYLGPILRVVRNYRAPRLTVKVDGHPPVEGGLAIASNTRNYGGLFTVADRARCDSGHLDVVVLTCASLAVLLRATARALAGGLSGLPGAVYLTGCSIRLDSAEPVPVEVDGDYFGLTPVEIEVEPARVPFLTPTA